MGIGRKGGREGGGGEGYNHSIHECCNCKWLMQPGGLVRVTLQIVFETVTRLIMVGECRIRTLGG